MVTLLKSYVTSKYTRKKTQNFQVSFLCLNKYYHLWHLRMLSTLIKFSVWRYNFSLYVLFFPNYLRQSSPNGAALILKVHMQYHIFFFKQIENTFPKYVKPFSSFLGRIFELGLGDVIRLLLEIRLNWRKNNLAW